MFGKRTLWKDYAGVIKQVEEGERRAPQHRQPKTIRDSGFDSFASPAHEVIFEDFRWFGTMLNQNVSEAWSIEELPDTLIRDPLLDQPELGRRYRVHYNACDMGTLQVTVGGFASVLHPEKFSEDPKALVLIDLGYLRFVPFDAALSLLSTIGMFLDRCDERDAAYGKASAAATAALTGYLWETVRLEDRIADFHHRIEGPYEMVRLTTRHWKENGIDPFVEWNGDRHS